MAKAPNRFQDKCARCGHIRSAHTTSNTPECTKKVMKFSINGVRFPNGRLMPCNCGRFQEPASTDPIGDIQSAGHIDMTGWSVRR